MTQSAKEILSVLDSNCRAFTFPMLDNGYVYLAATRMALYRSAADWAITIEVFGFSPRSGIPDTHIYTFGSRLCRQKTSKDFVTQQAYEAYAANNPNNESVFIFPIEEGEWQDPGDCELVSSSANTVLIRGTSYPLPGPEKYAQAGISLEAPPTAQTFELCRYLAAVVRDSVLATPEERRVCVPPELAEVLVLDEWSHPDLINDERPSDSPTFKALANVLSTGDPSRYAPAVSNTHWSNWPEGGTL